MSLISSAVISNAQETSETTSDPTPNQLKWYPMFTNKYFYSQSKYQVLKSRDTQKSAILINFSGQYPVKSFIPQDAAHGISVSGGKLWRVKTSWQCSLQADRQIRTSPQHGTFREKTQSKMPLRCPVDAWDVTQEKNHLQHWASGSTTARQD